MKLSDKTNAAALVSGFLSLISSSLITIFIPRSSNGGLSTPYRRIIFGLSFSDVIQSSAVILGPFLLPREENTSGSSWAFGNVHTCDLQGFMLTLGACTTCMYTLFLCLYYYCKLKRNMSDQSFNVKIEKKVHWFIIVFNVVVCLVALITKTFNPIPGAGSCQLVRKPAGCDPRVTGSCERGHLSLAFGIFYFPVAVPCICLLGTMIFMILIAVHVSKQGRLFRSQRMKEDAETEEETEADYVARLLRREATLQVIFYGLAFLMTYGWVVFLSSLSRSNLVVPWFSALVIAAFFPLLGVFNILIYTRPQVVAYRRLHSDVSRPVAFWLVIKAGGENPEAVAVRTSPSPSCSRSAPTCCCCRLLCCFTFPSFENEEKQSSSSAVQRLRALIRARFPSQFVQSADTVQNQAEEASSPEIDSMKEKQPIQSPFQTVHDAEARFQECPMLATGDNIDILRKSQLASSPKDAISRAFEKATQRAQNMALSVDDEKMDAKRKASSNDRVSECRIESCWSNRVSLGSSYCSNVSDVVDMEDNGMP